MTISRLYCNAWSDVANTPCMFAFKTVKQRNKQLSLEPLESASTAYVITLYASQPRGTFTS